MIPRGARAAAIVATLSLCAAAPAVAHAAPIDTASDHAALKAYHTYVGALVASVPGGKRADASFVSTVDQNCANVLSNLGSLSSSQVSQSALQQFGEEIGGDLALRFHSAAAPAFTKLSAALAKLRWSSPSSSRAIHGLLTAVKATLALTPSDLCADARQLAAQPKAEPAGTQTFLRTYLPESALAKRRLTPFLDVLARFQTAKDHRVITSIDSLVQQFDAAASAAETKSSNQVVHDLGLSSGA